MKRKWLCLILITLGLTTPTTTAFCNETAFGYGLGVTQYEVSTQPVDVKGLPTKAIKEVESGISEEEAMKIIKSAFPYLPTGGNPEISMEEDPYISRPIWHINMQEYAERPGPSYGYFASVDAATGDILDMSLDHFSWKGKEEYKGVIPMEQARQTAEKLAKQLHSDKFAQMVSDNKQFGIYYSGESLNSSYSFCWGRTEKGVKVDNDGISISVDALTDRVLSYNFRWHSGVKFASPGSVQNAEKLAKKVVQEAGMVPVYKVFPRIYAMGIPEVKLVYQLNSNTFMVDAVTGEIINTQGKPQKPVKVYDGYSYIKGDINPPIFSGQRISPSHALEEAKKFFKLLGVEGEVEQSGGGSGSGPLGVQEFWCYSVRSGKTKDSRNESGQVGIDKSSGFVVTYYTNGRFDFKPDSVQEQVSSEEAMAIAEAFINKINPAFADHLVVEKVMMEGYGEENMYNFRFSRVVNGIPFPMNGINIGISTGGKITDYRCDWNLLTFPKAEGTISHEVAAQKWLEKSPYKLSYFFPRSSDGREIDGEARLIYLMNAGFDSVDAVTGQPVTSDGRATQDNDIGYDFKGSWATESLQLLAKNNLLPPPEKFATTSPVTRKAAARVLMATARNHCIERAGIDKPSFQDVGVDDPDFGVIEAAVKIGVIDKGSIFNPDQPLTRKVLATWLVNLVGFKDIATIPIKITTTFEDITTLPEREQNYIALAYGLGFIQGDGSVMFRPGDNVTWEEFAEVLFKALPRIEKIPVM